MYRPETSLMMLLRRCGSIHIRIEPSFFVLNAKLEHQSICSSTFRITPWVTRLSISHFSSSLIWMVHLRGASMNGSASSLTCNFASPGKCPSLSNCSGYSCFMSSTLLMCVGFCMFPVFFRIGLKWGFFTCIAICSFGFVATQSTWIVTRFSLSVLVVQ